MARLLKHPVTAVLLLWIAQLTLPGLCLYVLEPHHPAWGQPLSALLLMPISRLGEFAAGMVMGLAFRSQPRKISGWLVLGALISSFAALSFNLKLPHEVIRNGLMVGPYCLLIWSLAGWRSRLLSSWPLQIGGEISYGMYILQTPWSHICYLSVSRLHLPALGSPWWMLTLLPFAWLTYVGIEKPCRRVLLHGLPGSRKKPIPTPQPTLP